MQNLWEVLTIRIFTLYDQVCYYYCMKKYGLAAILVVTFILLFISEGEMKIIDTRTTPTLMPLKKNTSLQIVDTVTGTGREIKKGDTITVNYTGKLTDGSIFDSSSEPFTTQIGVGNVIKGWDEGLIGMKTGGKRTLTIPSDMAYGKAGSPPAIPPDATLIFAIELLEVK